MKKPIIPLKKRLTYLRAAIQLLFFIFLPSAFTTAFSGIKTIFTQIGAGNPIGWSTFLTVLLSLCAYTILFGRFFCGYACAFGTLGDAIHGLYLWICKKCKKKPLKKKKRLEAVLSLVKYLVLFVIVVLCFTGVYSKLSGWNPWDVFSMLRAGHLQLQGYLLGVVLLLLILVGMALCERFFCRFLCPMGAVFSLLPVLPWFSVQRKKENCLKGCSACQRVCPADVDVPEVGSWSIRGDCFQCQKCVQICPKQNVQSGWMGLKNHPVLFTGLRAVVLAIVLILAGI